MIVAVDVGYGYTKAASSVGLKVNFPSVVAPASEDPLGGLFDSGPDYRVRISMGTGAREVLVGAAALRSLAATVSLSREKPPEVHDLLLLTGAYLVGAGLEGPTTLAVGLPLAYYRAQRDALANRLRRLEAAISVVPNGERKIKFDQVLVFPQGAGVALSQAVKVPASGYLGIVDIGTFTTDYLLFEERNGIPVPVPEACGSLEFGVHLVHRAIAAEFQKRTGAPLAPRMYQAVTESALTGKPIHFGGRDIDLSQTAQAAREAAARTIAQGVLAAWGDRAGYVVTTIVGGGGGSMFSSYILPALPGAKPADDPIYANAVGYLRLAGGEVAS